jgi:hypothetical protein
MREKCELSGGGKKSWWVWDSRPGMTDKQPNSEVQHGSSDCRESGWPPLRKQRGTGRSVRTFLRLGFGVAGVVNFDAFGKKTFAAPLATPTQDGPTRFGLHPRTETKLTFPGAFRGLVSPFHGVYIKRVGERVDLLSGCQAATRTFPQKSPALDDSGRCGLLRRGSLRPRECLHGPPRPSGIISRRDG